MKTCLRCGKEYKRLDIHLSKQFFCKVKYLNIEPQDMLNDYEKYYKNYEEILLKKFQCEFCGNIYSHVQSYNRHKKNFCKNNPKQENNNLLQTINNTTNNNTNNTNNTNDTINNIVALIAILKSA